MICYESVASEQLERGGPCPVSHTDPAVTQDNVPRLGVQAGRAEEESKAFSELRESNS